MQLKNSYRYIYITQILNLSPLTIDGTLIQQRFINSMKLKMFFLSINSTLRSKIEQKKIDKIYVINESKRKLQHQALRHKFRSRTNKTEQINCKTKKTRFISKINQLKTQIKTFFNNFQLQSVINWLNFDHFAQK